MLISNLIPKNYSRDVCVAGEHIVRSINNNKNTKKRNKNQVVKIQRDYISKDQFRSVNQRRLVSYTVEQRAVLDVIIANSTRHLGCDLSQNQLIFKLRQSYPEISWYLTKLKNIIRTLRDHKLIFIKFRVADQSVYYPHEYFLDIKVKRKFRVFMPSLTENKFFLGKKCIPITTQFITKRSKIINQQVNIDQGRLGILNIPLALNSVCESVSVSRSDMRVRARSTHQQIVKREMSMTPMIKKVSSYLRLTQAGQVKLLCFPEEALQFADGKCQGGRSVHKLDKPFFFFLKMCKNFCEERGIELDEEKSTQTRMLLDISITAPYVDESLPILRPSPPQTTEKKKEWNCVYDCVVDCNKGHSLEHTQRALAHKQRRVYTEPIEEIVALCPLECTQPCRVDGKYTDQHKRRVTKGKQFIDSMVPGQLKDEVLAKFEAQFPPEVAILPF